MTSVTQAELGRSQGPAGDTAQPGGPTQPKQKWVQASKVRKVTFQREGLQLFNQ